MTILALREPSVDDIIQSTNNTLGGAIDDPPSHTAISSSTIFTPVSHVRATHLESHSRRTPIEGLCKYHGPYFYSHPQEPSFINSRRLTADITAGPSNSGPPPKAVNFIEDPPGEATSRYMAHLLPAGMLSPVGIACSSTPAAASPMGSFSGLSSKAVAATRAIESNGTCGQTCLIGKREVTSLRDESLLGYQHVQEQPRIVSAALSQPYIFESSVALAAASALASPCAGERISSSPRRSYLVPWPLRNDDVSVQTAKLEDTIPGPGYHQQFVLKTVACNQNNNITQNEEGYLHNSVTDSKPFDVKEEPLGDKHGLVLSEHGSGSFSLDECNGSVVTSNQDHNYRCSTGEITNTEKVTHN